MEKHRSSRTISWFLIIAFLFLVAGILITGTLFYQAQHDRVKSQAQNTLAAIADLKVGQIVQWRQERLSDAELVYGNASFARQVEEYFRTPHRADLKQDLLRLMKSYQIYYNYCSLFLIDKNGIVHLSESLRNDSLGSHAQAITKEAFLYRKVIFSDLHQSETGAFPHLDLVVPLLLSARSDSTLIGALVLRIDPNNVLFPLIQSWPTPSRTSETLLLERDGDNVVYLNELRHRKNTTLTLRLPISNIHLPGSMAVRGIEGIVEGTDYRGVPVLVAIRRIPDSPWYMNAKVDQQEIYEPLRSQAWIVFTGMFLLIIASGAIIGLWWRHQRARFYREKYLTELERQALVKHFDYIIKYANDIILLINMDGRIVEANDQACRTYGYTREELIQQYIHNLRSPKTRTQVNKQMKQVEERGGLVFETEHIRKDGTVFPVEVSSRFIKIEGKRFYQSIIRDITDRKLVEFALRDSERRLSLHIQQTPLGFIEWDTNFQVIKWNPAAEKIFGYAIGEAIGQHANFIVPEKFREHMHRIWNDLLVQKGGNRSTSENVTKDGRTIFTEWYNTPLTNSDGKVIGVASIVEDITERKKADEVLHESEEKYRSLSENSLEGIGLSKENRAIYANKALLDIFGYDNLEEFLALPLLEHVAPESQYKIQEMLRKIKKGESHEKRFTYKIIRKDGEKRDLEIATDHVKIGNDIYTQSIFRDITERKRAEESLLQAYSLQRATLESTADGILVVDPSGRISDSNEQFTKMWNIPKDILDSRDDNQALDYVLNQLKDPNAFIKKVRELYIHPETDSFDILEFKDGRIFERYSHPQRIQGQPVGRVWSFRDITERKRAEEALHASEELYRKLISASPEAITIIDKNGKISYVSPRALEMFGSNDEHEVLEHSALEWILPIDHEKATLNIANAFKGIFFPNDQYHLRKKDNSEFIGEFNAAILLDAEKKPTGLIVIIRDITDRIRAEEALRESEERYRRLVGSVTDYIYSVKLESGQPVATTHGPGCVSVTGYTSEEYAANPDLWYRMIYEEDREDVKNLTAKVLTGFDVLPLDHRIVHKNGSIRWVRNTPVLKRDDKGVLIAFDGLITDITAQKSAEEALLESEETAQALLNAPSEAIYLLDTNRRIIALNETGAQRFGKDASELIGICVDDLFPPELTESRKKSLDEIVRNPRPIHFEDKRMGRYLENSFYPIYDMHGVVSRIAVFSRDVTERIQAEEALQQNESLFKMLVESSPVAIAVFSGQSQKLEYVSHRFIELFGYTQDDLHSMDTWWQLAYPVEEYRNQIEITWGETVKEAQREGSEIEPIESVITCQDGSTKYIETTVTSVGEQTLMFFSDLTPHRLAEEALRQTHAFNDLLIQTMPFGMDIVNEEGKILFMSKVMKDMLGTDATDTCCWEAYKDDKRQCSDCPLRKGITFGKPETVETTGVFGGKTYQISHVGMMYEGQKAMLEVFQNITEQKKLQQELIQSQKLLSIGTMAGGIAHDFNNILAIILGYSSILQSIKDNPQRFSEGVTAIRQSVDRGAGLVRQILTFARKTDVSFEPLNVKELVEELISMLQQTFPKLITFNTSMEKNLPYISADHTQMHQALLNLCVNARDAMPNGGEISIKTEAIVGEKLRARFPIANNPWYICITVSDTGMGMDESVRNQIFDPFFTTKEKGKGTGLGLSVVYGIVQAHHGFIDVESAIGQGTTFHLYFPVPQESSATLESPERVVEQISGGNETLLFVEDESLLMDMVQILLESNGYTVLTAQDGEEAVEVYTQHAHEIALVISDMGLPKLTGMAEFKKLKEINPIVKIIFASGYFEPDMKAVLEDAGAKGFLQKPYVIEDILKKIRKTLDSK